MRDRKKEKNIKHDGNITLDQVIEIARTMRPAGRWRASWKGTVFEMAATAYVSSVGCTVNGEAPMDIMQQIKDGELEVPDEAPSCSAGIRPHSAVFIYCPKESPSSWRARWRARTPDGSALASVLQAASHFTRCRGLLLGVQDTACNATAPDIRSHSALHAGDD